MANASTVVSINHTSGDIIIDGDPNWDDQELRIDGVIMTSPYRSQSGQSVGASVDGWEEDGNNANMMGIFYVGPSNQNEKHNNFMMTIGQNDDGLMSITDVTSLQPMTIKYSVVSQTKWILVLKFEDV